MAYTPLTCLVETALADQGAETTGYGKPPGRPQDAIE